MNLQKLTKLLTKLVRERQIEPDVVTYRTAINGLCKSGNTKAAIELLRSMGKHNFEADNHCYSMIIDSLCKDRMVSDAMSLFAEMTEKGLSPDVVTYSCLIWGLCNCRQWKEATTLLKEMMERDVFPNVYTCNILVNALCKEGMAAVVVADRCSRFFFKALFSVFILHLFWYFRLDFFFIILYILFKILNIKNLFIDVDYSSIYLIIDVKILNIIVYAIFFFVVLYFGPT
ncbi:hypothetical protein LguiB_031693 [Lonicera macranthoides]